MLVILLFLKLIFPGYLCWKAIIDGKNVYPLLKSYIYVGPPVGHKKPLHLRGPKMAEWDPRNIESAHDHSRGWNPGSEKDLGKQGISLEIPTSLAGSQWPGGRSLQLTSGIWGEGEMEETFQGYLTASCSRKRSIKYDYKSVMSHLAESNEQIQ